MSKNIMFVLGMLGYDTASWVYTVVDEIYGSILVVVRWKAGKSGDSSSLGDSILSSAYSLAIYDNETLMSIVNFSRLLSVK